MGVGYRVRVRCNRQLRCMEGFLFMQRGSVHGGICVFEGGFSTVCKGLCACMGFAWKIRVAHERGFLYMYMEGVVCRKGVVNTTG